MGLPLQWDTSCRDWEKRIVAGDSLITFPPLFPDQAEEALDVFDNLRMVDVAGKPLLGEICRPFIRDFVGQIFGSYEEETGRRLIRDYYFLISKKNGKSSIAAGIMLTALILNWRESAEFIIISPTVEIAGNSFKPAADMVRADPELSDLLLVQDHIRTITHRITGATLKVVAADSDTVGGKKAVGVLVDEHWLFGKRPNAESMFTEALGGLASRPEGFVIYLTTQADDAPAGVFKSKLDYARKVRDGEIVDPAFLPILYEFPKSYIINERGQIKVPDPEHFYITNPNLTEHPRHPEGGGSVDVEFLNRQYKIKKQESEESFRQFLAKHLNIEIGLNLRSDRWPGAEYWEPSKHTETVTLDYLIENSEVITVGIDGGGLDDLLGAAAVGRSKQEYKIFQPAHFDTETQQWVEAQWVMRKKWYLWNYAWAHPSVLERRQEIETKLRDFAAAKEMTLVDFIGQDVDELANMVDRIWKAGLLYQIGLDPNAIGGVLDAILLKGVTEDKMVAVNQGWRLAGSIKTSERKLAEGVLVHGGTALMNWCVGNAKVKPVGNAIVITKQVSGQAKIDPLLATFNAVYLMALNPPSQADDYNFDLMVIGG